MTKRPTAAHTAGLSLGVLIGFMIGLSESPAVGSVLGVLAGLVVAGIARVKSSTKKREAGEDGDSSKDRGTIDTFPDYTSITAFSCACLIAVVIGLLLRTNNVLGVSESKAVFDDLKAVGFSDDEAKSIVRQRLVQSSETKTNRGVLFASRGDAACSDLHPSRFDDPREMLNAFQLREGEWKRVADLVEQYADEKDYKVILGFFRDVSCK